MAGALAAPFLLYSLVKKAAERRRALGECAALAMFGLAFCLWTSQLLEFARPVLLKPGPAVGG